MPNALTHYSIYILISLTRTGHHTLNTTKTNSIYTVINSNKTLYTLETFKKNKTDYTYRTQLHVQNTNHNEKHATQTKSSEDH